MNCGFSFEKYDITNYNWLSTYCELCFEKYHVANYKSNWLSTYCEDCNKLGDILVQNGEVKQCNTCKDYFDKNDFYKRGLRGKQSKCKICYNKYNKERYWKKKINMLFDIDFNSELII